MMAAVKYILTAAQSLGSQDYYNNKSPTTILGLADVLLCRKKAGIDTMDYRMFQRKYLLRCLGKLREVSRQQ